MDDTQLYLSRTIGSQGCGGTPEPVPGRRNGRDEGKQADTIRTRWRYFLIKSTLILYTEAGWGCGHSQGLSLPFVGLPGSTYAIACSDSSQDQGCILPDVTGMPHLSLICRGLFIYIPPVPSTMEFQGGYYMLVGATSYQYVTSVLQKLHWWFYELNSRCWSICKALYGLGSR